MKINVMAQALLAALLTDVHANSGQTFANTERTDPYKAFNYRVTITGKKIFSKAGFQKVTGLKMKSDVVEYRDGNDMSLSPKKSAGLVHFDPITLERGMSEDTDMHEWFQLNAKSDMSGGSNDSQMKCSVKIELLDRDHTTVKTWECQEAWASDYETGDLDAQGNGVFIERMVIHHNGFKFINGRAAN